jgi:hypothetical protein
MIYVDSSVAYLLAEHRSASNAFSDQPVWTPGSMRVDIKTLTANAVRDPIGRIAII